MVMIMMIMVMMMVMVMIINDKDNDENDRRVRRGYNLNEMMQLHLLNVREKGIILTNKRGKEKRRPPDGVRSQWQKRLKQILVPKVSVVHSVHLKDVICCLLC